jgi:5-methyltetrahydrofolate--homocysteine methyltransferase
LESFVSVLNHQAVSIARTAIGNHKRVLVWGSMGPLDECIDPKDAIDIYREQIDALTAAGVDGFLIETMTRVDEALAALEASLNANLPVVVSLTVDSVGAMYGDETPGVSALRALVDSGASAVGFNCSSEFAILEKLLKRAREVVNVPLYVAPSAGIPTFEGNKWHYPLSPLKWANQTLKLRNAGAQIVGGCCGVTPKHIHTLWMHALVETGRSKGESKE